MKEKGFIIYNSIMAALIVIADILYMTVDCSAYITKTIASVLFVICSTTNFILLIKNYKGDKKWYSIFMLIGTIFSMMGDIFLIDFFIVGALMFAVGHILYVVAYMFLQQFTKKDLITWLVLVCICALVILVPQIYDFKGIMPLILVYAIIISAMLAKAFNGFIFNKKYNNWPFGLIFLGSVMFFLSDMMLLFANFAGGAKVFDVLCLSLYYPALVVLSTSIFYIRYIKEETEHLSLAKKIYCRAFQICFRIALPLLPYRQPKLLTSYKDLAGMLKAKNVNKILIVTDKSINSLGLLDDMIYELDNAELKYEIFEDVVPNPTIENVEKVKECYVKNECGAIIAFGGGSVMDCAKIAGARVVKPELSVEKMKGLLKIRKQLPPFVAIPTTAGTGSETTLAAVITDEKTHNKYPINDFCLIPHYAILDCNVTLNLPQGLTVTTGMDALTHAIEAFIGRSTTKYTRAMAVGATKLIVDNLNFCY